HVRVARSVVLQDVLEVGAEAAGVATGRVASRNDRVLAGRGYSSGLRLGAQQEAVGLLRFDTAVRNVDVEQVALRIFALANPGDTLMLRVQYPGNREPGRRGAVGGDDFVIGRVHGHAGLA